MIISHEHRLVFIKTHKTASSTVEQFLSDILGPTAVVATQLKGAGVRQNAVGRFNPVPELLGKYVHHEPGMADIGLRQVAANLRRGYRFYNHMPAVQIRGRMGRKAWDGYYTFCFDRNPWDKTISQYYYRHRYFAPDEMQPFDEWVRTLDPLPSDWGLYSLDGEVAVDFVGRYDHLEDDLRTVLDHVGIDAPIELGRVLGRMRRWDDPTYTDELDAIIETTFANEIRTFGFTKPPEMCGAADGDPPDQATTT